MPRRKLALVCLVGVVLCTSGFILARPTRLQLAPTGVEPGASGTAMLNYNAKADTTRVQISCRGLAPGTDYGVFFPTSFGFVKAGEFTTSKGGRGRFRSELNGDFSNRTVSVGDVNGFLMVLQ